MQYKIGTKFVVSNKMNFKVTQHTEYLLRQLGNVPSWDSCPGLF